MRQIQKIARRFSFAVNMLLFVALIGTLTYRVHEIHAEQLRLEQELRVAEVAREIQIRCLAENIYHEARGEPHEARRLVAMVTIARSVDDDPQWPKTICEVIAQERQYSWVLETAIATKRSEKDRWREALVLAREVYRGFGAVHKFPQGGACIRFYARTDQRGMSEKSKKFFATLIPVLAEGEHTFFRSASCRTLMPTV